jgi:hypothetical protein
MNFVFGQSKGILWGKVSKVIKPFSWSFCLQKWVYQLVCK